jgi:hypothetical protein
VSDDEVHAFINDLERSVGTFLLGRRTYEVMRAGRRRRATTGRDGPAVDGRLMHLHYRVGS